MVFIHSLEFVQTIFSHWIQPKPDSFSEVISPYLYPSTGSFSKGAEKTIPTLSQPSFYPRNSGIVSPLIRSSYVSLALIVEKSFPLTITSAGLGLEL